jgi:hypothetical protein
MKNFTRARGNSEKSFIYIPKEERVDGIESMHSVGQLMRSFKGVFEGE